ncbi:MAG: cation-transporting P-type ATPase, partial [Ideonella sp.]|nr:cation-transporting P-type ATPase [Ideonella sp.]
MTAAPQPQANAMPWHALSAEDALRRQDAGPHGLAETEVATRRARHGPNRLAEAPPPSPLQRLARQFNNLLLYVLMAAAAVTAALGHWVDSVVIAAVVL